MVDSVSFRVIREWRRASTRVRWTRLLVLAGLLLGGWIAFRFPSPANDASPRVDATRDRLLDELRQVGEIACRDGSAPWRSAIHWTSIHIAPPYSSCAAAGASTEVGTMVPESCTLLVMFDGDHRVVSARVPRDVVDFSAPGLSSVQAADVGSTFMVRAEPTKSFGLDGIERSGKRAVAVLPDAR